MNRLFQFTFIWLLALTVQAAATQDDITESWAKEHYEKQEVKIPMRDGVKLYTIVYRPRTANGDAPILICRTPYGIHPYGEDYSGSLCSTLYQPYVREGYILVFQDVRGRWMSEGEFQNIRPFILHKKKKQTDEASDTYDTVDWLLHHVKGNNGRVGIAGSSYPGFYAMMGGLSGHPAVKAIVPQAPVTDWFMGDDFHHNGALFLRDAFSFHPSNSRIRRQPTQSMPPVPIYNHTDEYSFFLGQRCLSNLSRLLGDTIPFWNDMMNHPNYDAWWKARDLRSGCLNVKPAVLVVGGLFDAEDYFGACQLYQAIRSKSPLTSLQLVIGPWQHGGWTWSDGSNLGHLRFASNTGSTYRNEMEFPFLQYYLKGKGSPTDSTARAHVFFSGENKWRTFPVWPPREAQSLPIYLHSDNVLSFTPPTEEHAASTYVSDPAHPVPYLSEISSGRPGSNLTEDQRSASSRPDVLTFKGEPLQQDLTVCGDVAVNLHVAISTGDADFVVKVIDQFPDGFSYDDKIDGKGDGYLMSGYQMMVRGDIMRGRYRNSFEKPEAFTPQQPTEVNFTMQSVAHTFKKGHRIVVQIQSSWFPLADLNPQQFVDIYHCTPDDFVKSNITIFHERQAASKITLHVLK